MTENEVFIENMKKRTTKFAVDVIYFWIGILVRNNTWCQVVKRNIGTGKVNNRSNRNK